MSDSSPRVAVILAGGRSKRFGEDKSLAPLGGKPMIQVLMEKLEAAGFRVVLSGPSKKLRSWNHPVVEDKSPFDGPLHALLSVWESIPEKRILFVGCDMPFLRESLLEELWAADEKYDLVLAGEVNPVQPLPAVLSRKTLARISKLIQDGQKSLKSLHDEVQEKTYVPIESDEESHWNINTPADLEKALKEK